MRRIFVFLFLSLFILPGWVGAKPVEEGSKLFSVDIPDAWIYSAKDKAWTNKDNTGAMVLSSTDVGISLGDWATNAAKQNPKTVINDDTLAGIPAKRLEFVADGGYKTYLWIAKKGKKGAILTLVHNDACPDDMAAIRKKLMSSYKWK